MRVLTGIFLWKFKIFLHMTYCRTLFNFYVLHIAELCNEGWDCWSCVQRGCTFFQKVTGEHFCALNGRQGSFPYVVEPPDSYLCDSIPAGWTTEVPRTTTTTTASSSSFGPGNWTTTQPTHNQHGLAGIDLVLVIVFSGIGKSIPTPNFYLTLEDLSE